jgi:hypothetical protein
VLTASARSSECAEQRVRGAASAQISECGEQRVRGAASTRSSECANLVQDVFPPPLLCRNFNVPKLQGHTGMSFIPKLPAVIYMICPNSRNLGCVINMPIWKLSNAAFYPGFIYPLHLAS